MNNAGGPPRGDFREWGRDDWIKAVDANMLTPIFLIKAVVDGMIERKFGRIVNITSASVKSPIPELGMSNGARAGLTGFVAGLARQIAQAQRHHQQHPARAVPDRPAAQRLPGSGARTNRPVDELVQERAKNSPHRPRRRSGGIRRCLRLPVLGEDRLHRRAEPAARRRRVQFVEHLMDPTFLPAWRLAELIRGGAIGCLELLDHYIARVERLDGRINAVVVRDFDRARERARALDQQRRDGRTAPLFGVPMTVKESFNIAGLPTTWGYEEHRDNVAARGRAGGAAAERGRRGGVRQDQCAGGPGGLAELQSGIRHDIQSMEPRAYAGRFVGRRRRGDGGGFAGLEIGSDIGGSIRVPAHYCGVFGHKPSWGLCSVARPVAGAESRR